MSTESERAPEFVYVRRDAIGQVLSVSRAPLPDHPERCASTHADLAVFAQALATGRTAFVDSDLALIRALEDLIDVLIHKDVLRLTDLPESVQAKLQARRRMRGSLHSLNLLSDGDDTV